MAACVEIVLHDRQETFSAVDRWRDLYAAAALLPGFKIPERYLVAWRNGDCIRACDSLERSLAKLFVYCYIGAVDFLANTPIIWGEAAKDRRAVREDLIKLKIILAKAVAGEAVSWQLLAAVELINKLCCDYQHLVASHSKKCSCLHGHDARWRSVPPTPSSR